jgi:alpha-pyrone synthase
MSNNFKGATILSIGCAVPPYKISQALQQGILESANGMNRLEKLQLRAVYSNSGIESRYSILEEFGGEEKPDNQIFYPATGTGPVGIAGRMEMFDKHAVGLGASAVNDCLGKAGFKPQQVTHLITFSCTGMSAPGLDIQLVERIGLNRNVERTCINFMGCYAAINALKVANYIVTANESAVVLLCGVELCTLHYQKSVSTDQLIANALFADGAAAVLVTSSKMSEKKRGFIIGDFYSEFEPAGSEDMAWRIGDNAFDIRLSTYVPDLIRAHIGKLIGKLFAGSKLQQEEIDWYAIHPGGIKILEACEEALEINRDSNKFSYDILREYGNMSSVTILFVLQKYFELISGNNGKKIMTCAFGPGLTLESMILTVSDGD